MAVTAIAILLLGVAWRFAGWILEWIGRLLGVRGLTSSYEAFVEGYVGMLMAAIQLRHSKLWYAVKAKNWSLADYELRQLDTSLKEGKRLYPNIPGSDIAGSDKVAVVIGEALKAKNEGKFVGDWHQADISRQARDVRFEGRSGQA